MAKGSKKEEKAPIIPMKKAEASAKVMELIQIWFKLKKDLKDTQGAYKEKIKGVEEEIEDTLAAAEASKD